MNRSQKLTHFIGVGFFLLWIWWNVYWFSKGQLAPSALLHFCGIPAPSTGMTRSVFCFLEGDLYLGFMWNPFTVPLISIYVVSFVVVAKRLVRREKLVLPHWLACSWGVVLIGAELTKLLMGPAWW